MRYFIEKLDQWKGLDASRLLQSLEAPYTESYVIYYTLSKVLNIGSIGSVAGGGAASNQSTAAVSNPSTASATGAIVQEDETNMMVYKAAEQQCLKIKQAMVKLLGLRAQTRIEELNAQIEAAVSATAAEVQREQRRQREGQGGGQRGGNDGERGVGGERGERGEGGEGGVGDEDEPELLLLSSNIMSASARETGIQRIENNVSPLPPSPVRATETPNPYQKEFHEINMTLKRIAVAGGFPSPTGYDIDNSHNSYQGSQEFVIGGDRHRLLHDLSLDPTHKLPDSPSPSDINLTFYSHYFLPSPPSNIEAGGWSHMIQSPLYPRSLILREGSNQGPQGGQGGQGGQGQGGSEADQMVASLTQLTNQIKASMLFMMDDNIVCSLSQSPIAEESLKKVRTNVRSL